MTTYATSKVRLPPAGISALELDGKKCGIVHRIGGGAICAEVVEDRHTPGRPAGKHLGPVRYEEFEMQVGFAMGKPLFDWIAETWKQTFPRRDGAVIDCNGKLEAKKERKFQQALITETRIPTLDVGSREPAWLTVKFMPEFIEQKTASGKVQAGDSKQGEKLLAAHHFRLEVEGLDCSRVARIDSFAVTQSVAPESLGEGRLMAMEPGVLSFPNLRVTFAEPAVPSWLDWFDDFVVKGNCGEDAEKSGTLTLLNAAEKPLAKIKLLRVGIFRIGAIDKAASEEQHKLGTADLYCEAMEFEAA